MSQQGPAAHLFHGLSDKKILRCDLSHLDVDDRSLVGASRSSINRNTAGKVELTPPRGACWGLCMVCSLQISKVYCKLSLHNDQSRSRRCGGIFEGLAEEKIFTTNERPEQ
jgi:hypothetical protein